MTIVDEPRQASTNPPDAEALIKEARRRQRLRWLSILLAVLLLVIAGVVLSNHMMSSTKRSTSPSSGSEGSGLRKCTAADLKLGDLGGAGAGGTGILTVRLVNISRASCSLKGWPTLAFVSPAGKVVATTVSHTDEPGPAFLKPATIRLASGMTPTAGFVVESRDIPTVNATCQNVSAIRVALPGVAGVFNVPVLNTMTYHLCEPGHPVTISAIVKAGVLYEYAQAAAVCSPDCLASGRSS
jgi:hypothetical protein